MEEIFKYGIAKTEQVTKYVRQFSRSITYGAPTKKQMAYHAALVNHLKNNGIDTKLFDRPRNNLDYRRAINGMITVCKKNGIWEDWHELHT